jgi:transposase
VFHVADDRTADTLAGYFAALSIGERLAIEAIAMDMWDPYRKTVRDYVPDGDSKIVFDRFHVMRHVIEAMDQDGAERIACCGDAATSG